MRIVLSSLLLLLVSASLAAQPAATGSAILPGTPWSAGGASLQAHGGGILKIGRTWYWNGENKTQGSHFYANSCYSSRDLVHWKFVNDTLKLQPAGDLGPDRVVERPKILYNAKSKTYVMYMHIDDARYKEAKVGVATSSTVCGNYTYRGSFQPLGFQSRDIGVFQDDDGAAYLLSEDRVNGLRIDALSDDYLRVTRAVAVLPDREAPAMLKVAGTYYLFSSHLTGWKTNDNEVTTATSLAGPWSPMERFTPEGSRTFDSQTTFVLPVAGKSSTTFIYMGDRWLPNDLAHSTYIWLPLAMDGTHAHLAWHDCWLLDVRNGTWKDAPPLKPSSTRAKSQ